MTRSIDLVREFHERFRQPIAREFHDDARNLLRLKLIAEELQELAEALGYVCADPLSGFAIDLVSVFKRTPGRQPNRVAALDALTDIQYVLDGTYLEIDLADVKDAALAEVHRSNLSKLGADGLPVYRADGKVAKGPAYVPPDLERVLANANARQFETHDFVGDDCDCELCGEGWCHYLHDEHRRRECIHLSTSMFVDGKAECFDCGEKIEEHGKTCQGEKR